MLGQGVVQGVKYCTTKCPAPPGFSLAWRTPEGCALGASVWEEFRFGHGPATAAGQRTAIGFPGEPVAPFNRSGENTYANS